MDAKKKFINFLKKEGLYGYFLTLDNDKKNEVLKDGKSYDFLLRFYNVSSCEVQAKKIKKKNKYNDPDLDIVPKKHKNVKYF